MRLLFSFVLISYDIVWLKPSAGGIGGLLFARAKVPCYSCCTWSASQYCLFVLYNTGWAKLKYTVAVRYVVVNDGLDTILAYLHIEFSECTIITNDP